MQVCETVDPSTLQAVRDSPHETSLPSCNIFLSIKKLVLRFRNCGIIWPQPVLLTKWRTASTTLIYHQIMRRTWNPWELYRCSCLWQCHSWTKLSNNGFRTRGSAFYKHLRCNFNVWIMSFHSSCNNCMFAVNASSAAVSYACASITNGVNAQIAQTPPRARVQCQKMPALLEGLVVLERLMQCQVLEKLWLLYLSKRQDTRMPEKITMISIMTIGCCRA